MFVLRASVWLAALERFRPDIAAATRAAWAARSTDARLRAPGQGASSPPCPAESIDYAVMEKLPRQPTSTSAWCRWPPAGTTSAPGTRCGRWRAKDAARQRRASATSSLQDSRNTLVHATSRLVSVVGVDDVVVVETADAVLVADRSAQPGREEDRRRTRSAQAAASTTLHRKVHRPWGWYDSIDTGVALPGQAHHGQARRQR